MGLNQWSESDSRGHDFHVSAVLGVQVPKNPLKLVTQQCYQRLFLDTRSTGWEHPTVPQTKLFWLPFLLRFDFLLSVLFRLV